MSKYWLSGFMKFWGRFWPQNFLGIWPFSRINKSCLLAVDFFNESDSLREGWSGTVSSLGVAASPISAGKSAPLATASRANNRWRTWQGRAAMVLQWCGAFAPAGRYFGLSMEIRRHKAFANNKWWHPCWHSCFTYRAKLLTWLMICVFRVDLCFFVVRIEGGVVSQWTSHAECHQTNFAVCRRVHFRLSTPTLTLLLLYWSTVFVFTCTNETVYVPKIKFEMTGRWYCRKFFNW